MNHGRTIALNLYDEHIKVLERLAKRHGSRSAAVQRLLEEAARDEIYRELDEAYQQLPAVAGKQKDGELTEELLRAASWPEEWVKGERSERKRRRGKGRKTR